MGGSDEEAYDVSAGISQLQTMEMEEMRESYERQVAY